MILLIENTNGYKGESSKEDFLVERVSPRNRNKSVNDLRVSGWASTKGNVLDQIDILRNTRNSRDRKKAGEYLAQLVRDAAAQIDNIEDRLKVLKNIYDTYNSSGKTSADIDSLYKSLREFKW